MILGMSLGTFTALHVIISLVALLAGIVVAITMCQNRDLPVWTHTFLWLTLLTSLTGYLFPAKEVLPSHILGALSLLVLIPAFVGYYCVHMRGAWRWMYVTGSIAALYFNCFAATAQSFQKIPFLHQYAPTGTEPAFIVAQLIVLGLAIWAGVVAVRRFHPPVAAHSKLQVAHSS